MNNEEEPNDRLGSGDTTSTIQGGGGPPEQEGEAEQANFVGEETTSSRSVDSNNLDAQWRLALAEMKEEEFDSDAENDDADDDDETQPDVAQDGNENSPDGMHLTDEEREWAKQIKQAVEENPELENLTDFEYAQYALVTQPSTRRGGGVVDGLEAVMKRVHQMQAFREDQKFLNTCSQAKRLLRETMDVFPGFFLSLYPNNNNDGGGATFVFDSTKLVASTFSSNPKAYNAWASTIVYVLQAASPDLAAARNGISFHVECQGFDLMKNFGIQIFSRAWSEVGVAYPIQWKTLKHFHTSVFKNLLVSMAKRFVPRDIHSKFQVGCVSELGRLDKVYLMPNEAIANQRFENKMMELLQRRQENQKLFSL